jgi:ABC-2 type transport system ATP-binding protein
LEELQERHVMLLIPREQLTERVAALLDRFDVVDLEVNDPPIEDLIGGLYTRAAEDSQADG